MLRRRDKRREVSSVVALVAPSERKSAHLYSWHRQGSIDTDDVIAAIQYFRRKVGRPLTIVWDRLNQHRASKLKAFVSRHRVDFRLEYLPPYAPDLNPEEGCNGVVKNDMRNGTPDSVDELRAGVRLSFQRLGRRPDTLAAFFRHAGLDVSDLP